MWHISKWLIIEQNGWKFGPHCPRKCICIGFIFVCNSLSSVWGHSVHFAKFSMGRFSTGYYSHSFIQFQPNFMINMLVKGEYRLPGYYLFWWSAKKLKILWQFEIFVSTGGYMGLEISKRYSSCRFHLISAKTLWEQSHWLWPWCNTGHSFSWISQHSQAELKTSMKP